MQNRAGYWRKNLSGKFSFFSFVPTMLTENFDVQYTHELVKLAGDAQANLVQLAERIRQLPATERKLLQSELLRQESIASNDLAEGRNLPSFSFMPLLDDLHINHDLMSEEEKIDVKNLIRAIEYAISRMEDIPISGRLLMEVHDLAMSGERYKKKYPGYFRTSPNWLGEAGSNLDTARFVPPTGDDMTAAITNLEKFIHAECSIPVLIRAALIHYQFETIHPFIDGNGRIGRVLNTLFLRDQGILDEPVLLLSHSLKQWNFEYSRKLSLVQETGDYEAWIEFYLKMLSKAAIYTMERLELQKNQTKK